MRVQINQWFWIPKIQISADPINTAIDFQNCIMLCTALTLNQMQFSFGWYK